MPEARRPEPPRPEPPRLRQDAQPPQERFRTSVLWLLAMAAAAGALWILDSASMVFMPFFAALFVALAVAPVDLAVRERLPRRLRWLGRAAAMAVVAAFLAAFFAGIFIAAQQAAEKLSPLSQELRAAAPGGAPPAEDADGGPTAGSLFMGGGTTREAAGGEDAAAGGAAEDASVPSSFDLRAIVDGVAGYLSEHGAGYARTIMTATASTLAGLALIFFLVLLMLVEAPRWREKTVHALGGRREHGWEDAFAAMARSFRWYVVVRCGLGAVTATLYVAWLAVWGVDLLVVWWVLAFLLNFIPTIGSIIAGALPVLYALATTSWTTALIVALGLLAIEQVMGNYVDPRVQGKQLSVSPLVTFFSLLLFGWLWGVPGALLAVPLAVLAVIACAHVEPLRPAALLMSDSRDMEELEAMTHR